MPIFELPLRARELARSTQLAAAVALTLAATPVLAQSSEARSLDEVRNTVVNLLEALVQKGVMTKEQAQAMVAAAQDKAEATAREQSSRDAAEAGAVRVTHVPEIVKQQIRDEVRAELKEEVAKDVIEQAKAQQWGVPGALPEWIRGVRVYGDVRTRAELDSFADGNGGYLNFNTVNEKGGIDRAGEAAFVNAVEDRERLVGRLRTGVQVQLGGAFGLDFRLASGNILSPVSTNQTLGGYGGRWTVSVDKAAVLWNPVNADRDREFDLRAGRFANPFVGTSELIWDNDLTFEGVSATYALDLFGNDAARMERGLFLTVGALPLQEVELSPDDKWLYGGQIGAELTFGDATRLRVAGGYFAYDNITGVRNALNSSVFDFTAPRFMQRGNTLFDIRNDADNTTNLYALAGEYRLASGSLLIDVGFGAVHVMLGGEYVRNIGWDAAKVRANTGFDVEKHTTGYDATLTVGHPALASLWDWRAFLGYRYLERDAVLDAFTDSDFHLGGTDAKGYQVGFDLGLARGAWLRLRYLTADAIDGQIPRVTPNPFLGIDVWQLDLNGQF